MHYTATYKSPVGDMLLICTSDALVGLHFIGQKYFPRVGAAWEENPDIAPIHETIEQLDEYFVGTRDRFDVPLAPYGTSYQRATWDAISKVPYGETITYGELARRVGHPHNARAAGAAAGQNPIGILVPCHRIIGANGKLTGYAGGLDKKRALLALEAEHIGRIQPDSGGAQIQRALV